MYYLTNTFNVDIRLEANSGPPIYRQIVNRVRFLVASRQLEPGQGLPPIRNLAKQLAVNPNTVAKAYRELEKSGIVKSRQGSGTAVAGRATIPQREERIRFLREKIDDLLTEAGYLDMGPEDLIGLLRERTANFEPTGDAAFSDPLAEEEFID